MSTRAHVAYSSRPTRAFTFISLFSCGLAAFTATVVRAESPPATEKATEKGSEKNADNGGNKTITLQQKVEPGFRIEPVVQRSKARRGDVVPFDFTVSSTGREVEVEVAVTTLRQEESGVISFEETSKADSTVKFSTPKTFTLAAGKSVPIRGELTVPNTRSNFFSLGFLVRDKGQSTKLDEPTGAAEKKGVRANVKFITQYILRCDVEIDGAGEGDLAKLKFDQGNIVAVNGNPVARVYVDNPTDNAFEFQVHATVKTALEGKRPVVFPLFMPSRRDLEEPDRSVVKILPHARLRLEASVTVPLVPGPAGLNVSIYNGRRDVYPDSFPVAIVAGQFPALDASMTRVDDQMTVSPGQIMLSQAKGGHRTLTLKFSNTSGVERHLEFSAASLEGKPLEALRLSQESADLPANRTQSVRLTLKTQKDAVDPEWGFLTVRSMSDGHEIKAAVPLAVFFSPPTKPDVKFSDLTSENRDGHWVFHLTATNNSPGFVPLNGVLELTDDQGRRSTITAGFGKWIYPGQTSEIEFRTEGVLQPGTYQTVLSMQTFENLPATATTNVFTLEPQTPTTEKP